MKPLDSVRTFVYKPWLLTAASIAAAAVIGSGVAQADSVLGVLMPKKAVPEGTNRFMVPGTLRDAVKFFKKKFKRASHVFLNAIDHPSAKVVHVRSGDSSTAWEGINISYYGRKVHVFIVPRGAMVKQAPIESESGSQPIPEE